MRTKISVVVALLAFTFNSSCRAGSLGDFTSANTEGKSCIINSSTGAKLRLTPYGDSIIRVQAVPSGEGFWSDNHYEMVESHAWPGRLKSQESSTCTLLQSEGADSVWIVVEKKPLRIEMGFKDSPKPVFSDSATSGISFNDKQVVLSFAPDAEEHFCGLGHGAFGRQKSLDLKDTVARRNREEQSSMVVPFFISSKGYGLFVNSMFRNEFSFKADDYHVKLDGGQADYFFIAGPAPKQILDHYTKLTGRPRLPAVSTFGIGLSDKRIADSKDLPSDENWWKDKIKRLREGKWPIDVIIHDNSWRNGKTAKWEWAPSRYPDPAEFASWSRKNGLENMLDFNRQDCNLSDGWKPEYSLPGTTDYPDFTSTATRKWFWQLFWTKSFDPALKYPGDILWLDEFDQKVSPTGTLGDGRAWDEDANYYFFYMAKSVGEGWDSDFKGAKRPYTMCRGITAGAQRWATLWSGDISSTYDEMALQIRGMLSAGISGFPFWSHDAGGFRPAPSEGVYRQWSMAMGSFSPIWRPHGIGMRFPWLYSTAAQDDYRKYANLRYSLLPYTYTLAHEASATGLPIARPMLLEYPDKSDSWSHDLQYLWGPSILVAPVLSDGNTTVSVWLPSGTWYSYWDDRKLTGPGSPESFHATGELPLYIKAGAILPMAEPMQTTAEWDHSILNVEVYKGANGEFEMIEDDGHSEKYLKGAEMRTKFTYDDAEAKLVINGSQGTYENSPSKRSYRIRFHGLAQTRSLKVDGKPVEASWNPKDSTLSARIPPQAIRQTITIETAN